MKLKEIPFNVKMAGVFILFCVCFAGILNPVATFTGIMLALFCISVYTILKYFVSIKSNREEINNEQATI